ncbi:hypothetical protein GCM10027299_09580 [Larkinella ripae]
MEFRKATRKKAKIRLGLSAPSGAGKTYSALLIAYGLCGDWSKIALIDTENGSADLYEHLGDFNVVPLTPDYSPERYIQAINICHKQGMEVIIIDSITHEWDGKGGCLEIVDQMGGKYQNWAKVTPRHQAFIEAIVSSPCHMITTVRRKQDYEMTKDNNGKIQVEKAGLKEVTREGFEYELTVNLELDMRHNASASKDRTELFAGKPGFVPSIETGKLIRDWCEKGLDQADLDRQEKQRQADELEEVKQEWLTTIRAANDLKTIDSLRVQLKSATFDREVRAELINELVSHATKNGFSLVDSSQKDKNGNPIKVFAASPQSQAA